MATKNILFTESWQEYEIGSYPMARVTYAEGSIYKPDILKGMTGAGEFDMGKMAPAFSKSDGEPGRSGVYVLPSLLFGNTWESMINKAGRPFMEFSSRSFNVTKGLYHPPGFDVIPCPTRPGRKRLKYPGDKLFGAVGSNATEVETASGRTNLVRLSFVTAKPVISKSYSIAFVVRFPRMNTWGMARSNAWIFSVAEPDYYPTSPELGINNSPFRTMHPREPFLLFGNARGFRVGGNPAETQLARLTSNADAGLPWLRFTGIWGGSATDMEEIPSPSQPGKEGSYFKFEYDRDYFIEVRVQGDTNPTALKQAARKTIYIDGEVIVKNYVYTYSNGPVSIPAGARAYGRERGFSFNFSSGAAKGQTLTTTSGEAMGSVVLSDIIWSEMDVSDDSFTPWPASTRVWGEDPNSDVEAQLQNPTEGSNASVAGKSAVNWKIGEDNVELTGKPGNADKYKTDGSSLPDFAGSVLAVHTRAIVRPDAEEVTFSLTQGAEESESATIPAADSGHYSAVDHITRTQDGKQWTPQTAADTPFGVKIKG
ncbi:hypothetical protein CPT_Saba_043 [Proteus phage Saba]|uniref:Uncharacterized protein n=1 Tax=Proteus phage Saba TaxID=2596672 RepID=A0A5B9N9X6_9CAUD|nr:hypothetical protein JT320_gp43 [Proteus phage Saba]QEG09416.1 hypothetical protein CPT_Saba_043 [Proteus phage Saba]